MLCEAINFACFLSDVEALCALNNLADLVGLKEIKENLADNFTLNEMKQANWWVKLMMRKNWSASEKLFTSQRQ